MMTALYPPFYCSANTLFANDTMLDTYLSAAPMLIDAIICHNRTHPMTYKPLKYSLTITLVGPIWEYPESEGDEV